VAVCCYALHWDTVHQLVCFYKSRYTHCIWMHHWILLHTVTFILQYVYAESFVCQMLSFFIKLWFFYEAAQDNKILSRFVCFKHSDMGHWLFEIKNDCAADISCIEEMCCWTMESEQQFCHWCFWCIHSVTNCVFSVSNYPAALQQLCISDIDELLCVSGLPHWSHVPWCCYRPTLWPRQ